MSSSESLRPLCPLCGENGTALREFLKRSGKSLSDFNQLCADQEHYIADLEAEVKKLLGAMAYFVERVDRGEIRSIRTYAQFKGFLAASRLFKGEKNENSNY